MMLSEMVREGKPPRLQRGVHMASNGIWIEGPSDSLPNQDDVHNKGMQQYPHSPPGIPTHPGIGDARGHCTPPSDTA